MASYSNIILAEAGLVSYWRLGESSGTTANDSKGSNNLTYAGGFTLSQPSLIAGDRDSSVKFNGSTGWAHVASSTGINGDTSVSMECWVSIPSNPTGQVKFIFSVNANDVWIGIETTGKVSTNYYLVSSGNVKISSTNAISTGVAHHLVSTFNTTGGVLTLYVDGAQVNQITNAHAIHWEASANISIGSETGGTTSYMLNGTVDEVAIYNTALSQAQVTSHYNSGRSSSNFLMFF